MHAVALLGVLGQDSVGREANANIVRCVAVVLRAAVRGPHVLWDGHAVLVVPADHVASGGHAGHDVGRAAAEVVEADADSLLVLTPGPDVELAHLRDHVGQSIGGGAVMWGGLILVQVQVTSLVQDHVRVVIQHCLAVLKLVVQVASGEGLHVSIAIDLCQLGGHRAQAWTWTHM